MTPGTGLGYAMMRVRVALVTLAMCVGTVVTFPASSQSFPVLMGAGDIASCDSQGDEATARLLDGIPGTVFTAGDNVYEYGTHQDFMNCYQPTWGRHRTRTRPVVGNHEYLTSGAAAYFTYFGAVAGHPKRGYYSYDFDDWHIVVLNSNCWAIGGCHAESPQVEWLRADLHAHRVLCTAAFWHHPRFSSGLHGGMVELTPIWRALYVAGADLVVTAHDHHYERFAPQDQAGRLDRRRGLRQFVVGTGGRSHYPITSAVVNSEVRHSGTYGVLKLTLAPTAYTWEFVPERGKTFTDSGTSACH
ncbi:MAG: metallophosphoesterase family protein [Longimicrobiales bacterium]